MRSLLIVTLLLLAESSFAANKLPGLGPLPKPTYPYEGTIDKEVTIGVKPDLPFVIPGGALGYWGVGNGGDYLRIGFSRAREYAANVILKIKPNSLGNIASADLRQWILNNQKLLAADILQTEHAWTLEEKATCAWTVMPDEGEKLPIANPVQLSYPACRKNADTFLKAAQILIHESVHHFRGDEDTADRVAIGIIDAWQSGLMDSTPISTSGAPQATQRHSAVWTGSEMIIVGGFQDETATSLSSVTSYDPRTDKWTNLMPPQGFGGRHDAAVAWTGDQLFIWGGFRKVNGATDWIYDGALYNSASKSWTLIKKPDWWTPRSSTWEFDPRQTVTWTGGKLIVWGGVDNTNNKPLGAIYDPKAKTWSKINTDSIYAPLRIGGHSAIWTGSKMVIWGGYAGMSDAFRAITNEGAIYDAAKDDWLPTVVQKAPYARAGHQAIWTGQKMVIVSGGGVSSRPEISSTGGQYDLETGEWTTYVNEQMAERVGHRAVWNGEEILIIGGRSNRLKTFFGELYAYSPFTNHWRTLPGATTPPSRVAPSIVWTGSSAIVWSGSNGEGVSQPSGAVYYP